MNLIKAIDKELDKHLPKTNEEPKLLHRAMRYSVFSGGKRIRPLIVLESCKACGGRPRDAIAAACAVEMVHTYSLIHDDLPSMDDDDYRRGKRACHRVFGEWGAVLAGDALLTLAFKIAVEGARPGTGLAIVRELSEAAGTYGMVGGQAADLAHKLKAKSPEMLYKINYLKTARLFEASAKIGAIAAGAGNAGIKRMAGFGANFGMAFQIIDDIIDCEDYAKAVGAARANCFAAALVEKAKASVEKFGRNGNVLKKTADSILMRTK